MSKTIVVVGATRTQGSGVVNALLKEGFWKVRGIIPNTQGERAKALASQDVEMVSGDSDDVDSLIKAFHVSHLPILSNIAQTNNSSRVHLPSTP
jgi:uncharacterized protein YbjT (DUF2867 family)